ncbi:anthocyanidin 3-O-glucoside 6''-O-acyltransferase-like [Vitis riparia]|uniref:anthocyanidin 3-O-glucoside 6''-O-acyltransferase-like n=1 Tax=Vitis riparia TaxID=96939 RepID=UPI00155A4584|nr:anthocyanidin 3-O-glucoside 6''-O-acyltransferase-like [Vitis riparia]
MAPPIAVRVLDRCRVAPPPGSAPPTSLPLTFFDIPWLLFPPFQPLFFFQFPIPTSHFTSATLPKLKHSLSLTLLEYFPFSGRISNYPESETPAIVYAEGDSVGMTVAEADGDFDNFCGHHSKDACEFHQLVPRLSESDEVPMMAVQITVFSNAGISIGLALHHAVSDGRTFTNFMKTWSSIYRNGEKSLPKSFPLPFYDRSVIKELKGLKEIFLQQWRKHKKYLSKTSREDREDDSVRATFVMSPREMEKVKKWIMAHCRRKGKPPPPLLSAYVLTCAFVWVCLCEARAGRVSTAPPDTCFFGFNAGGITRLDYPVPAAYLGNCVAFGRAVAGRSDLMGEEGIVAAAEAIGRKIKELDGEVLGGAERWILEWEVLTGSEVHVVVLGSPKLDLYEVDFGWGRPRKIEEVSIDEMKSGISLTESRDIKGGIEIGLVLPNDQMDVFASLFHGGLKVLP